MLTIESESTESPSCNILSYIFALSAFYPNTALNVFKFREILFLPYSSPSDLVSGLITVLCTLTIL